MGVSVSVDASAALSKSGAYHRGLVPVFRCLLRPLPLQGENKHRSTTSRRRLVHGWRNALQSPSLFPLCDIDRPGVIPTPELESNDDSDSDVGIICSSFWWSRNRGDWNRNRSRNRGDWNRSLNRNQMTIPHMYVHGTT